MVGGDEKTEEKFLLWIPPFSAVRTLSVLVLCGPLHVPVTGECGTEDTRKQGGRIVASVWKTKMIASE